MLHVFDKCGDTSHPVAFVNYAKFSRVGTCYALFLPARKTSPFYKSYSGKSIFDSRYGIRDVT